VVGIELRRDPRRGDGAAARQVVGIELRGNSLNGVVGAVARPVVGIELRRDLRSGDGAAARPALTVASRAW
jgi:hypothetical protein